MHDAVWNGDVPAIEALIAAGESPNGVDQASGWSAPMLAAENQQLQSARALLDAGADPNYAMHDGWTALHHAVDSECDGQSQTGVSTDGSITALLVAAGADTNVVWTHAGRSETPIEMASHYRYESVTNALLA